MSNNTISQNSLRAWLLAARPKTLTAAVVPVMIGLSAAAAERRLAGVPAVLCLLFAMVMQIDANFVNDYFDGVRGNDNATRLGPPRACSSGWVSLWAMRRALTVTTLLACLTGLPLAFYGGVDMVLVGVACVVFCFLYTTWLSYKALGDVLVVVFFGLVPVGATYYLQTATLSWQVLMAAVACGVVIDTLLLVNNIRDIDNDRTAGKRTLVVIIGAKGGQTAYLLTGILGVALNGVWLTTNNWLPIALTAAIYLPLHIAAHRKLRRIDHGKELNVILGTTARNILLYGIATTMGLLL